MKNNPIFQKILYQWPNVVIFFAMIFFLCTHAPYLGNNAPTYTDFTIIRQPIYSIFIWLFHWVHQYQFEWVMWTQGLLTFFALVYTRNWLIQNLNVSNLSILLVFFLVLMTISFHYQVRSLDDPEGLAFPIFILTFFNTISCFKKYDVRKIILLSILVSILVLTRTQFYFYYGILVVLSIWYLWKKVPIKKTISCIVVFTLSAALINLADRGYHYVMNGSFTTEPFFGLSVIIQPLYLASNNSENYFLNPAEKKTVQNLLDWINSQELNFAVDALSHTKIQYYEYANQEYSRNYLPIQSMVNKTFTGMSFDHLERIDNTTLSSMNDRTLYISKILFFKNMKKNIYLYCYKVIDAMGGIATFLFFCLLFCIAIFKIFRNRESDDISISEIFVFLILLTTFFNAMIVAVAEPNCARYFCYTQFLLYCFGAYLGELIFYKTKSLS